MKVQQKILLILILILAFASFFGYTIFSNHRYEQATRERVDHSHSVIREIDQIGIYLQEMRKDAVASLLVSNKGYRQHYFTLKDSVKKNAGALRNLVSDHPQQYVKAGNLMVALQRWFAQTEKLLQENGLEQLSKDTGLLEGPTVGYVHNVNRIMKELKETEAALLEDRLKRSRVSAFKANRMTMIAGLVFIVFLLILTWQLRLYVGKKNKEERLRIEMERLKELAEAQQRLVEEEKRLSDEKYRQLVDNATIGMSIADRDGRVNFVSRQLLSIVGYGEDYHDKYFYEFFPSVVSEKVKQLMDDLNRQYKKEGTLEIELDGQWLQLVAYRLFKDMDHLSWHFVLKNITDQKRIEQDLIETEKASKAYQQMTRAIINGTPLLIYLKDLTGKYLLVNHTFCEFMGKEEEEVLGKTIFDLSNDPSTAIKYDMADQRVVQNLQAVELETVVKRQDGETHLNTLKFPVFNDDGILIGVAGVGRDVTDLVRYRQMMVRAKRRAEEAEKHQERFLASMSHEIRTPMNGIIGVTNMLAETTLSEEQIEYVKLITQSSSNLLVLINDILDLSRIKSGALRLEEVVFNVSEVVQQVTDPIRVLLQKKNVQLLVKIDPTVPVWLKGDPHRINQVLTNLVGNAAKFTETGSVQVQLNLLGKQEEKVHLQLKVKDTGIGIPLNRLSSIFEPFAQASAEISRKFGGTGLGLSITKQLVEMMGGQIIVESMPGHGTCFTIELFLEPGDEVLLNTTQSPSDTALLLQSFKDATVLIVEDNEINQRVMQMHLGKWGFQTVSAWNGREAVDLLEQGARYDLIIMDLQMPEMNGFQTTAYIREKIRLNTPIIAMTASTLNNERVKCMELGMNAYLSKPFNQEELAQTIGNLLEQHRSGTSAAIRDSTQQDLAKAKEEQGKFGESTVAHLEEPMNESFSSEATKRKFVAEGQGSWMVTGSTSKEKNSTDREENEMEGKRAFGSTTAHVGQSDREDDSEMFSLRDLEELGDEEMTVQLLELFLKSTPETIDKIKEASDAEDWNLVRQMAHRLKSSAGVIRAMQMHRLLNEIEIAALDEPRRESIPENIKKLYAQYALLSPIVEGEWRLLTSGRKNHKKP